MTLQAKITLYTLDELDGDARDKAIETMRESCGLGMVGLHL